MLAFIFGVVLFALGICVSVALHEAGHLLTAKWFGMKVRRYFIGFGPKIFSFHRGGTEYGLKAIPAGGFCDIAGMTALDEVTPDEAPRAMWRFKTWKRSVVMVAGSVTHFIIGFVVLYLMAVTMGLPNLGEPVVGSVDKCAPSQDKVTLRQVPCGPGDPAPARNAGMQPGDEIVAIGGTEVSKWTEVRQALLDRSGPTQVQVERGGDTLTLNVNVTTVQRVVDESPKEGSANNKVAEVGAIGATQQTTFEYGVFDGIVGTTEFTGTMFRNVWEGLLRLPERVPALVEAIGGGERPMDTPVSMVGASIIGGDAVEQGLWEFFLLLLASLNFFVGVFNLLPLLPMDGGHIAVLFYEKIRDWLRRLRGLAPGGPVDYTKLAGVTMVVIFIGGAYLLLTVTADIVNPIRLGGQ